MMDTSHTERLPTGEEIADDSLDGFYAIKHFHGKSLAEAEEMFAEAARKRNPLTLTEDLLWMEPIGFRFYIRAAIRFALSERAAGESSLIDGLAGTISLWHEHHPGELTSLCTAPRRVLRNRSSAIRPVRCRSRDLRWTAGGVSTASRYLHRHRQ
jgi:hypothetical protein